MSYAVGEDRSNFQAVRSWGSNTFAVMKATEGTTFVDPTFASNWANARAEGKPRAAYHFFHPALSATAQAAFFLETVHSHGGFQPGDAFMADVEITVGADGIESPSSYITSRRQNLPMMALPVVSEECAHQPLGTPVDGAQMWCGSCRQYCGGNNNIGVVVSCNGCTTARVAAADEASVSSGAQTFMTTVEAGLPVSNRGLLYTDKSMSTGLGSCARWALFIAYYASSPPSNVAPWPSWTIWQKEGGGGLGGGDLDYFCDSNPAAWFHAEVNPTPTPKPPTPTPSNWTETIVSELPTLSSGSLDRAGQNQAVHKAQGLLKAIGVANKVAVLANLGIDGDYGSGTVAAVKAYQKFAGLSQDGVVGPKTWTKLLLG